MNPVLAVDMQVSPTFAVWWTLGALAVGAALMYWLFPPALAWWQRATEAYHRATYRAGRVLLVLVAVALVGGLFWFATMIPWDRQ